MSTISNIYSKHLFKPHGLQAANPGFLGISVAQRDPKSCSRHCATGVFHACLPKGKKIKERKINVCQICLFISLVIPQIWKQLLVSCASRVGAQIPLSEASFTEAVQCDPILSNVPGALPTLVDKPDERAT